MDRSSFASSSGIGSPDVCLTSNTDTARKAGILTENSSLLFCFQGERQSHQIVFFSCKERIENMADAKTEKQKVKEIKDTDSLLPLVYMAVEIFLPCLVACDQTGVRAL